MSYFLNRRRRHSSVHRSSQTGDARRSLGHRGALVALWALVISLLSPALAYAATIAPTNVTFAVDRNSVTYAANQPITTTFNFCIPNGYAAGDSFEITLPPALSNWPPSFPINNGATTVFNVTINTATPAVATFTLTAAGAAQTNLCAVANFGATSGLTAVGTYSLDYVIGGTTYRPPNSTLTVNAPVITIPTQPAKGGYTTNPADECRTTTSTCMAWSFYSGVGNHGVVTFSDPAGSNWQWACTHPTFLQAFELYTFDTVTGTRTITPVPLPSSAISYTCTPSQLDFTIDTSGLAANQSYRVAWRGSALVPGGVGGVTYTNSAQFVREGVSSTTSASWASTYVGGSAVGDSIIIYKRDGAGHDADTAATAVSLPNGTTQIVMTIRNNGTNPLTAITVSDAVVGTGTLDGLSCNFSQARSGAPTSGTTWAGPFAINTQFTCTGTLNGVVGDHSDTATVSATGNAGVSDTDPFFAQGPPPSVSVGDHVWVDVNKNGIQDDGAAAGLAGVTVTVSRSDGAAVTAPDGTAYAPTATTTDAAGAYLFDGLAVLPVGTHYIVTVTAPAGYVATVPQAAGSTTTNDSSTDSAESGDLAAGESDLSLDFGFVPTIDLTLTKVLSTSGVVYPGDTVTFTLTPSNLGPGVAVAGWSVTDVLPSGLTLLAMDGGANYSCSVAAAKCTSTVDLPVGAGDPITVTATVNDGVTTVQHNVAYIEPVANEVPESIPLGDPVPTTATDTSQSLTNNDSQADVAPQSRVSVGDYVWFDTNRNGLQDAGELPVAGVTVTLTDAAGGTRVTSTDASGYYWFDDLTPGAAYTLTFTKPAGYAWTVQNAGGDTADKDAGNDSDVLPATGVVSFTAAASGANGVGGPDLTDNPTLDAGLVELVSVGDYVWFDVNRDGIQDAGELPVAGMTVKLLDASGAVVATTTTNASGYYWFTDLWAGASYTVEFVKPAGYAFTKEDVNGTADVDAGTDSDADVATGRVPFTAPATGGNQGGALVTDNPTIDAGLVELVSIGDYVWYDRNRDGLQGAVADEPVVAGVVVNLYAADGTTLVKSTTTNASGFYSFTDLLAGETYVVEFVKPADTVFTQQNAAGNSEDTKDSDANTSTGRVTVVAPSTGANSASSPDNPTIDAGLIELVSIGDYVWYDRNLDGQQGAAADEPVVAGVVVNLYGPDGVLVGSTTTDANGFYSFNNLLGGVTYTVEFVKPADTIITQQNAAGNTVDAVDSDADVTTGKVTVVAPVSGNNSLTTPDDPTIDAGLVELVSVGDYVWWDANRDGLQDATDVPLEGVVVHLLDAAGNPAVLPGGAPVTATTDATGHYWFTNLVAGVAYQVKFDTPAQFTPTVSNALGDTSNSATADLTDSDPIKGVVAFTAPATGDNKPGAAVTDNPGLDAGFIKLVSIGDYVWYDRNRDGLQGAPADEPVAAGVTVNLLDSAGNPAVLPGGAPVTTVTDANGFYSFTNLLAGETYVVQFVKPDQTVFTTVNAGDDAKDSDADVATGKVTITAPADGLNSATTPDDRTIDAGLVELVSIGDYVWYDRNRDGQQGAPADEPVAAGVTVNLLDSAGNPAVLPGGAPVTTVTDANGFYSFTNLLAGETYVVQFVKPADTIFTMANEGDDATDSDADVVTGKVTVVAPITGANSASSPDNPTIDAGLIELVSIGDYVWWDTNRDGIQSSGELPVAGVTVNLLDSAGNPAVLPGGAPVTTVTDANGFYSFNNLIGGVDYVVQFVKPDNTTFTWMDEGDDNGMDSDADVNGLVPVTAPVSGDNSLAEPDDPTIDAGLVKLVSVGDYVWLDVNRNGVQDQGEAPVPGVTVNLYDEWGGLAATAVTDANGFYSFTDLWAGATYVVEFVKPMGTSFTTVDTGLLDSADSDADLLTGKVTITAPADGFNSATTPDDPTIDAGLVHYNLNLVKKLTSASVVYPGDTVTFTLTPHNDGPADALAGWSVTEVVPDGLTFESMSGPGYVCADLTCVASNPLTAGATAEPITVTMKATGTVKARNVAYVDKAPQDVPEDNPLGPEPPTKHTDTSQTPTDNDSEALVTIVPRLPDTGSDVTPFLAIGLGLLAAGGLLLAATRRRRTREN